MKYTYSIIELKDNNEHNNEHNNEYNNENNNEHNNEYNNENNNEYNNEYNNDNLDFHIYQCSTNLNNEFIFKKINEGNIHLLYQDNCKIIFINKKYPLFLHKIILYYSYIPSFFRKK